MPLTDAERRRLAEDVTAAVARIAPAWTEGNAHDPGITVVQILAYVLEDLRQRREPLDADGLALVRRIGENLAALAETGAGDDPGVPSLTRAGYFDGQLLGADDFRTEQEYVRARLGRRNRPLQGSGVATGLEVHTDGDRVVVAPGLALDAAGEEIELAAPIDVAIPPGLTRPYVLVRTERARVSVEATLAAEAVALARLRQVRGAWRLDPSFEPPRARR